MTNALHSQLEKRTSSQNKNSSTSYEIQRENKLFYKIVSKYNKMNIYLYISKCYALVISNFENYLLQISSYNLWMWASSSLTSWLMSCLRSCLWHVQVRSPKITWAQYHDFFFIKLHDIFSWSKCTQSGHALRDMNNPWSSRDETYSSHKLVLNFDRTKNGPKRLIVLFF